MSGLQTIRVTGPGGEVVIRVNAGGLIDAAVGAFQEANQYLQTAAVQEATRTKWAWPNEPSPRDVVRPPPIGGGLRSSIRGEPEPGDGTAWLHTVNVSYAAPVLLGYRLRTKAGIKTFPARNIYRQPLTGGGFRKVFDTAYARLLRALPPGDA